MSSVVRISKPRVGLGAPDRLQTRNLVSSDGARDRKFPVEEKLIERASRDGGDKRANRA